MSRLWPTEDDNVDNDRVYKSKLSGATSRHKSLRSLKRKAAESDNESEEDDNKKKVRPQELKSNVPVSRLSVRDISGIAKQVEHIDPRFADYAGEVNMAIYRRNYGFINELKQQEIEGLKKKLRKVKNVETQREIKDQINRRNVYIREFEKQEKMESLKQDYYKKQTAMAEQGVKPKFLNKKTTKMLGAAEQFLSMSENKVQSLISKKRTRRAQKEKKYMPTRQAE